jgi:hypothetical protein
VRNGDWAARSAVLQAGLRELHPYLLGFQEVIRNAEHETASEILGSDYDVRHQTAGLLGDGSCAAIASRWPVAGWHEVDLQLTPSSTSPSAASGRATHFGLVADLEPA